MIDHQVGQSKTAVEYIQRAIGMKSTDAAYRNNPGIVLQAQDQLDEAVASYDRAIAVQPDYAEAYWNKSLTLLLTGDLPNGWKCYEWRWKNEKFDQKPRNFGQPLWLGDQNLTDQTILVYSEQGLGDTLQFCRYVHQVADLGAKVILDVQPPLVPLLKASNLHAEILAKGSSLPPFDCQCPLMSLPLAFQTTLDSIPAGVPYLQAETKRIQKWEPIFPKGSVNIGICWQGNKTGKIDVGRSFPVSVFQGVSRLPGVKLFSLQKHDGTEQLHDLPDGMVVTTLGDEFDANGAFLDTAAVMHSLDLIITSDTSVAHLAGALGRPVWVALKYIPDWRWLLDTDRSPWYPTMRLFRQRQPDDWSGVFQEIEEALAKFPV